ncbi:unnamed protein product, partial [Ascophyllum nodosum]
MLTSGVPSVPTKEELLQLLREVVLWRACFLLRFHIAEYQADDQVGTAFRHRGASRVFE